MAGRCTRRSTYRKNSVHLFTSLVLFALDPVLVEIIEELVDKASAGGVLIPFLCIVLEQLEFG